MDVTTGSPPVKDFLARKRLIESARAAVTAKLSGGAPFVPEITGEDRRDRRGAFVSLHIDGELRGCIGYIESDRALVETVVACAISAATADPRFPPLTPEDLRRVVFEISLLSAPRVVAVASEIVIGRDGVIVTLGGRKALLLPQVASKMQWSVDEFLAAACRKIGRPASAWRLPGARIEIFSAEVFGEQTGGDGG